MVVNIMLYIDFSVTFLLLLLHTPFHLRLGLAGIILRHLHWQREILSCFPGGVFLGLLVGALHRLGPCIWEAEAVGWQVLSKDTQDLTQRRRQETGREAFTLTQGLEPAAEYRKGGLQISGLRFGQTSFWGLDGDLGGGSGRLWMRGKEMGACRWSSESSEPQRPSMKILPKSTFPVVIAAVWAWGPPFSLYTPLPIGSLLLCLFYPPRLPFIPVSLFHISVSGKEHGVWVGRGFDKSWGCQ